MKQILAIAATLAALAPSGLMARPSPRALAWMGSYSYEELIPRGQGEITGSIEHVLTLSDKGCTYDATGVMSDEHIRCSALMVGNSLIIGFVSYADGKIVNQYGTAVYKPGTTLFSLSRTHAGLATKWGAVRPDAAIKGTHYFTKAR